MAKTHNTITIAEFIFRHLETRPVPRINGIGSLKIIDRPLLVLRACKAELITGGRQPFYDYDEDVIVMPPPAYFAVARIFTRSKVYAATLAHEVIHWTGHRRRLGRPLYRDMYDETYCKEELVAELGAALLCHDLAISKYPALPHARYLNAYLATLPNAGVDLSLALGYANHANAYLISLTRRQLSGQNSLL